MPHHETSASICLSRSSASISASSSVRRSSRTYCDVGSFPRNSLVLFPYSSNGDSFRSSAFASGACQTQKIFVADKIRDYQGSAGTQPWIAAPLLRLQAPLTQRLHPQLLSSSAQLASFEGS